MEVIFMYFESKISKNPYFCYLKFLDAYFDIGFGV